MKNKFGDDTLRFTGQKPDVEFVLEHSQFIGLHLLSLMTLIQPLHFLIWKELALPILEFPTPPYRL